MPARALIRSVLATVQKNCKIAEIVPTLNDILVLLRSKANRQAVRDEGLDGFLRFSRLLLQSNSAIVRVYGLRIIREWIDSRACVQHLIRSRVDFFVGMCLEQTAQHVHERAEAIKVVNRIVCVDQERFESKALLSTLIAVAQDTGNSCRLLCIELLRRAVVNDMSIACNFAALNVLFAAALEPSCQSISKTVVLTILYLLNEPKYREKIRNGLDIQTFLLPFTAVPLKVDQGWRVRCEIAQAQICLITKTWVGIRLLADANGGGFRALVELLHCGPPVKKVQLKAIMQLFANILKQNLRCKVNGRSFFYSGYPIDDVLFTFDQFNPVNNYSALLLLGLINAGLIQALAKISMDASEDLKLLAIRLINQILDASCNLLPEQHFAKLLTLPDLVNATMMEELGRRIRASKSLIGVSPQQGTISAARSQMRQIVSKFTATQTFMNGTQHSLGNIGLFGADVATSVPAVEDGGPSTLDLVKASNVLKSESYTTWDWSAIDNVFQRLLDHDLHAFDEVSKTTFLSTLANFFSPGTETPSHTKLSRTPRASFKVHQISDVADMDLASAPSGFGGIG